MAKANGGQGRQLAHQAIECGAAKLYAAAHRVEPWADSRAVSLLLDVTASGGGGNGRLERVHLVVAQRDQVDNHEPWDTEQAENWLEATK